MVTHWEIKFSKITGKLVPWLSESSIIAEPKGSIPCSNSSMQGSRLFNGFAFDEQISSRRSRKETGSSFPLNCYFHRTMRKSGSAVDECCKSESGGQPGCWYKGCSVGTAETLVLDGITVKCECEWCWSCMKLRCGFSRINLINRFRFSSLLPMVLNPNFLNFKVHSVFFNW